MKEQVPRAIIIGAGPAGLTAGLELLRRTGIRPIILEASQEIGGISRTINYRGNRMDIGGHRFFSKSDRVMDWWSEIMPIEDQSSGEAQSDVATIQYRGQQREIKVAARSNVRASAEKRDSATAVAEWPDEMPDESAADRVMLVRPRKSRIYFLRSFFDYPISLNRQTLSNLGGVRTIRVAVSYVLARLRPRPQELTLEDFLINRFGKELYLTFFKSYTEKVWGTPCSQISAEWGAQRIKGLSLTTAIKHFLKSLRKTPGKTVDVAQASSDTSLIERFLYPKFGPGQLWERVAELITDGVQRDGCVFNGELHMGCKVAHLHCSGARIEAVTVVDASGKQQVISGEYFISTMPIKELIQQMDAAVPANVREVGDGLEYRDFITIGLLVDRLKVREADGTLLKDNWIYIQEPEVKLGRLQIFNNWSPHLVSCPDKVWIGLEYFCNEADPLWQLADEDLKNFAINELETIGLLDSDAVSDGHVVRVPKAYPAYFGTYDRLPEIKTYIDSFENLFLIGRNGMHRYNNQDHSMLTAMAVVDGLEVGYVDKKALWEINIEQEYHEKK